MTLTPAPVGTGMTRPELREASDALRRAAERVTDPGVEERVYDQSRSLAELAAADRGPDQGRLDRHRHALREIADAVDDADARSLVEEAEELVQSYREGVEGV